MRVEFRCHATLGTIWASKQHPNADPTVTLLPNVKCQCRLRNLSNAFAQPARTVRKLGERISGNVTNSFTLPGPRTVARRRARDRTAPKMPRFEGIPEGPPALPTRRFAEVPGHRKGLASPSVPAQTEVA